MYLRGEHRLLENLSTIKNEVGILVWERDVKFLRTIKQSQKVLHFDNYR